MSSPSLLARYTRHRLRRLAAALRHGRALRGSPILFANAFPKSGTHLLTQILKGLTHIGPAVDSGLPAVVMYDGASGAARPLRAILADLRRLRPGDIAYGHLHALPEITAELSQPGRATFFLYRDPRDVAVSHVHYVTEIETNHVHHDYYRSLPDFDARLRASILGRPEMDDLFPDIRRRFEPYLGWLDTPNVMTIRFEDLIENRRSKIGEILQHLTIFDFRFSISREQAVEVLIKSIAPQKSPTYRSGKTGGWRERFSEEHKALFKDVAGELLIRLGYEADEDW